MSRTWEKPVEARTPARAGVRLGGLLTPKRPVSPRLYRGLATITFVVFLGAWSLLTYGGLADPLFLPAPHAVLEAGYRLLVHQDFAGDVGITVARVLGGFAAAAVLGVPLGILMGTFPPVEAALEPLISFIRYMPASAFIPLFILWLGIGEVEKVAVIFVGSFFQLVLMVAVAAAQVPDELLEQAYTLGAGRSAVVTKVLLPALWPGILDNLRLILGWAWTYIIVAELVAASAGIGQMILESQRRVVTENILFGILTIGILGLSSDLALKALHRRLFPWL